MSGRAVPAGTLPVPVADTEPMPQPSVRVFARLKLSLIAGSLHGDTGRVVGFIAGLLLAFGFTPVGFIMFALLRGRGALATDSGVLVYTAVAIGWVFLSLLIFGLDETLDPTRLVGYPLTRGTLARGMFVSALIGVAPLSVVVVLAGSIVGLTGGPVSVVVAILAVALELALCITLARSFGALLSGLLRSRRGRDLAMIAGLALVLSVQLANVGMHSALHGGLAGLAGSVHSAAGTLRWLPPGMLAHAVGDARTGRLGVALVELAVGAALVALLWWVWIAVLGRMLVSPDASTQGGVRRSAASGSPVARLPLSARVRGVVAKELRYDWRDPRRRVGWLSMLGVGVIVAFSLTGGGRAPIGALPSLCFAALAAGLQEANQFGIDGSPTWMNVATTRSAGDLRGELAARNLAHAQIAVPCLLALGVVVTVISGMGLALAVTVVVVALGVFGITIGIANVLSVVLPYSVPRRGTSPFGGSGAGRGCLAGLASMFAMCLTGLISLPLVGPALFFTGAWPVFLVAGPLYGALWAWVGRRLAARIGYRRLPELLSAVSRGH